jgi:short-subunit dehydrogenase
MPRALNEQVVLITGASSGIGRVGALQFARRGASLVLAARGRPGLDSLAQEVRRLGARCLVAPADVSRADEVAKLDEAAVSEFGRIDTWINNAAVSEYASIVNTEPGEFERIIEVNLLGQIYGSREALLQMQRQGAGTIINVASALALRSVPLQAAYCAAKHGVKGFTEAMRVEAKRMNPAINVCLVMPSSMNTPLFSHARSKMGRKPMPIPPIYEPETVAESLIHLAEHPQAELIVGGSGKFFTAMERLSPGLLDWYLLQRDRGARQQLSDRPDDGRDNLFQSMEDGAIHGEFGERAQSVSVYTRALEEHPVRKTALLGGVGAGLIGLTRKLSR